MKEEGLEVSCHLMAQVVQYEDGSKNICCSYLEIEEGNLCCGEKKVCFCQYQFL